MIGPARLPPADVARINADFITAFSTPEVREMMAKQGNTINISTPDYAAQFFRTELTKYATLVKKAGVEPVSAEIAMIPQNFIKLEGSAASQMLKLYEALDDHEDVQSVAANFEIDDATMEQHT